MEPRFVPFSRPRVADAELVRRAREVHRAFDARRSVRHFSPDRVPREVIAEVVAAASTAPSGAHRQPWTFVAVSDPAVKRRIREAAEEEERRTYAERMTDEWREALEPLGVDAVKPFLEVAPWLVVLFRQDHGVGPGGEVVRHYYVGESVGIAAGMFLAAVEQVGLCALTHTPSPMGFLGEILGRPAHEKAMLLMPVGYPADDAVVPDLVRKPLDQVLVWKEA